VGITATLPLFTGLSRIYALRGARADEGTADANELAARYNVAFQVKQQYFAALAAKEAEAAAKSQLDAADQQFKAAAARVQAGAATKSDSLRSVITVGNARLALLTARNNVRNANAALTRLVQSPEPVTPITADTADPVLVRLDSAALQGLAEDGPAVRAAKAQLNSSQAAAKAALGSYLPSLALSYGTTGNNPQQNYSPVGAAAYQNVLRLSMSYTLTNGLVREQGVVQTRVAEENASAQLRDALFLARQNFAQQLGLLRTAEQQIVIQHASVEAADEDLRVQTQRYTLGASTLLDVLTSQTALNQARAALIQARFDYRNAKAQLEQLIGRDL
jgi:outer membrane protein